LAETKRVFQHFKLFLNPRPDFPSYHLAAVFALRWSRLEFNATLKIAASDISYAFPLLFSLLHATRAIADE